MDENQTTQTNEENIRKSVNVLPETYRKLTKLKYEQHLKFYKAIDIGLDLLLAELEKNPEYLAAATEQETRD